VTPPKGVKGLTLETLQKQEERPTATRSRAPSTYPPDHYPLIEASPGRRSDLFSQYPIGIKGVIMRRSSALSPGAALIAAPAFMQPADVSIYGGPSTMTRSGYA
jgi:hypothetical protein